MIDRRGEIWSVGDRDEMEFLLIVGEGIASRWQGEDYVDYQALNLITGEMDWLAGEFLSDGQAYRRYL